MPRALSDHEKSERIVDSLIAQGFPLVEPKKPGISARDRAVKILDDLWRYHLSLMISVWDHWGKVRFYRDDCLETFRRSLIIKDEEAETKPVTTKKRVVEKPSSTVKAQPVNVTGSQPQTLPVEQPHRADLEPLCESSSHHLPQCNEKPMPVVPAQHRNFRCECGYEDPEPDACPGCGKPRD